jgi:glycosyltransferase involved in cell wall biosynthesis
VEHDITFDLYAQLLALGDDWDRREQLELWKKFETGAWRNVDRIVVMSERDRNTVKGASAAVLPNGVDVERFQPASTNDEEGRLLFIGSFAHLPNVLAMDFFLRDVWPKLRGARLHIIAGSNPEYHLGRSDVKLDLTQPGIEVEDFVADVRPAYERAAVVIAPLRASAGTNIKILEAMAMAKPIVSTRAGVNGLDLAAGEDFLLAGDDDEFTAAVNRLLADPQLRCALGANARRRVEREYNWDAIAAAQKQLYEELLRCARS